jgi:hypothetical protein
VVGSKSAIKVPKGPFLSVQSYYFRMDRYDEYRRRVHGRPKPEPSQASWLRIAQSWLDMLTVKQANGTDDLDPPPKAVTILGLRAAPQRHKLA